ncbi:hypothetical protein O181_007787 [Austropuccinia psidii MF-1]|uniref:Uncharacterized protein n=1 Tax=Austropuccinia psidii MF-1 TaxID=1389203 RepID=A0A9Q3GIU0_9BASI|nr:hypothetical protein [Austropuccinia psidii MF-1]
MEDARTSTSSQRLFRKFKTLLDSPEAERTAIPVFRSEQFPTSRSIDIPVSVQELVYGGKEAGVGTSAQIFDMENELLPSKDQKKELAQKKDKSTVEALQDSKRKNLPQEEPNKGKQAPKGNQKGKQNSKKKGMLKWNKPYPQSYRISKGKKTAIDSVFNMAGTLIGFKNKEEKRMQQSFQNKWTL